MQIYKALKKQTVTSEIRLPCENKDVFLGKPPKYNGMPRYSK